MRKKFDTDMDVKIGQSMKEVRYIKSTPSEAFSALDEIGKFSGLKDREREDFLYKSLVWDYDAEVYGNKYTVIFDDRTKLVNQISCYEANFIQHVQSRISCKFDDIDLGGSEEDLYSKYGRPEYERISKSGVKTVLYNKLNLEVGLRTKKIISIAIFDDAFKLKLLKNF